MMLGASLASFIFIMASSLFGMPISGTHTVVGALIGAGISGLGSSYVNWGYLGRIIFSWFLSPALTTILSFCLFTTVCYLTLGGRGITESENVQPDGDNYARIKCRKLSFNAKLIWLTLISGLSTTMVTYMVVFLASQESTPFDTVMMQALLPIAFIGGLLLCRIVLVLSALKTARIQNIDTEVHSQSIVGAVFKFWSAEFVTTLLTARAQTSYSSTKQDIAIIGTTVNEEGTDAMSEHVLY